VVLVSVVASNTAAATKYIFAGWDISDVTPQEILDNADKFDAAGCDGVAIGLANVFPSVGQDIRKSFHIAELPRWKDEDVSSLKPVLKKFGRHRGLRHSFFRVNLAPRKSRLAWNDDAAWALCAENLATAARLAKEVSFEGLVIDPEDYHKKKQNRLAAGDPPWVESKALARRRGCEIFSRVFAEYPNITILSFMLLTADSAYARTSDPVAYMESKRDLWPSFVNGILDAMPPMAKIVDGNEECGYRAEASKRDFYKNVRDQLVGVLPLVAPENRVKYRAQMSVSFGLYIDSYAVPTNSPYYFGPVRGKRITHFENNLRQATECADEYVWFWGERGFYVDWPADLKEKSGDVWRSHIGLTWRLKYFRNKKSRYRPWRDIIDGDVSLILRGVKDPVRCVREEHARQKASGEFRNLYSGKFDGGLLAQRTVRVSDVAVDGWYGVVVRGRGEPLRVRAHFQGPQGWRWDLGEFQMAFSDAQDDGWRDGAMLVRVPDGATGIFFHLDSGETKQPVEFKDFEVFKIK
jgi:hypothetical protein